MDNLTLGRVLWRSFFLQAAWNYTGQQNLGWASAFLPALEKIYGRGTPDLTETTVRSLEPVNTQPYMSGLLLGAVIKAEELGPEGGFPPERIKRFRNSLMTAFAAVGDAFFWNALLPAAVVLGMFWAVRARPAGIVVMLVLFNLVHLTVRGWGLWIGYKRGLGVISMMDRLALPVQALRIRLFTAGALGALTAWVLASGAPADWSRLEVLIAGLTAGPVIWLCAQLLRRNLPVEALIYGALAVILAWTHALD